MGQGFDRGRSVGIHSVSDEGHSETNPPPKNAKQFSQTSQTTQTTQALRSCRLISFDAFSPYSPNYLFWLILPWRKKLTFRFRWCRGYASRGATPFPPGCRH